MKVKVCGMKYPDNIKSILDSKPDFIGHIFYDKSPRYVTDEFTSVLAASSKSRTVGVFVNASIAKVIETFARHGLDYVQLHGNESVDYIKELASSKVKIIKALHVAQDFDWITIKEYVSHVEYFLFDTSGKSYGGNGYKFDWAILNNYAESTPFFLSGGIGPDDIDKIKALNIPGLIGVDINSCFETAAGIKDVELVDKFIKGIRNETNISSQ